MQGQWIGRYSGTNTGDAVLELDAVGSNFEGWVYIYDDRHDLPPLAAFVVIPSGATRYSNPELPLTPLDPLRACSGTIAANGGLRSDGVVPVAVKFVAKDVDGVHLVIGDFDACRIGVGINFGSHL